MAEELGCDWVLLYSQHFKIRVNAILDKTSFYCFSLDIPKELEIIFDSSLSSFWGGSTIINLKSSKYLSLQPTVIFCLFLWIVCLVDFLVILLFLFWILSSHISFASLWNSFSFGSFYINFHMIFVILISWFPCHLA